MVDDPKPQFSISPSAIQAAVYAFLRYIAVLAAFWTAVAGFVAKRDLSGAIAYVQSSDFLAVISAAIAIGTMAYGLYKTWHNRKVIVAVKNSPATYVPDSVLTVKGIDDGTIPPAPGSALAVFLCVGLAFMLAGSLSACATVGADVRLNANKAFLVSQLALKSAQQSVLAVCSIPTRPVDQCNEAIDLLHKGADAEAAGFTAQQAGNAADLQTAVLVLTNLPAQLSALGVLEK